MNDDLTSRIVGALLGGTGILAAAFGAHGLERLTDARGLRLWGIAVFIQLVTAPVLLWLSSELAAGRGGRGAAVLLTVGCTLFSGTLYAMSLGAPKILGAVTPLGGLCLAAGWFWLVFAAR